MLFVALVALGALIVGACGAGDEEPDTAVVDDEEPAGAVVPRDDDGAIGEPSDEDSQTDNPAVEPSGDEVVPESSLARVVGGFGDMDIDLLLDTDTRCAIRQAPEAGDEPAAEVTGSTGDGATFELDWSLDDEQLQILLELDGTRWTVTPEPGSVDESAIRLARNGEVLLDTTFRSDSGEAREALLYVNCQLTN